MKKLNIQKSLFAATLGLLTCACSSDGIPLEQYEPETGTRSITFEISTPSSDKLTVSDGYTRAVGDIVEDEPNECAVKKIDIYVFTKGSSDTDFAYNSLYSFTPDNADSSKKLDGEESSEEDLNGTLNGSSSMTCNIQITEGMKGKQLHFVLIANESVSAPGNNTSLSDFRNTLATYTATDNSNCELLVGIKDEATWFPMCGEAETADEVNPAGENISVKLVRNVARIDIENNTPNLVITGLKLKSANDKSCIMAADGGGINIPASGLAENGVSILPLTSVGLDAAANKFWEYDDCKGGDETATPSEDELKDANTKTAFYLYEQKNTVDSGVRLEVSYRLTYKALDQGDVYQEKTIEIPFKSGGSYIDVKRNTLYRVVIGDGNESKTTVANITVETVEWTGHKLYHEINIGDDNNKTEE